MLIELNEQTLLGWYAIAMNLLPIMMRDGVQIALNSVLMLIRSGCKSQDNRCRENSRYSVRLTRYHVQNSAIVIVMVWFDD